MYTLTNEPPEFVPLENMRNWYLQKPLLLLEVFPLLDVLKGLELAVAEKKIIIDRCYNSRHCLQKLPKTSKKSKTMLSKHKLVVASILILIIVIFFTLSIVLLPGNER